MDAIIAYDLTKQYGSRAVLRNLRLQIPEGTAFACVGEKGSGKTTAVRLLSGLCRPTAGECFVMGFSPVFEAEKLHAVTGIVLDTARLYETMTVSENLRFFAEINGVEENDALDRISFLLHKLNIWEDREEKIDDLPTGVLRRASLARALIHNPKVLLMDEPAEDSDEETAGSMRELLSHLVSQEGLTVFLSTRDMNYAQQVCKGFALLRGGVQIAQGDLESLRQGAGARYRAALRLAEGETLSGGFRLEDGLWQKEITSEEELSKIISQTVADGKKLYEAHLERPTLEEIYAAFLAGGKQRAGEIDEQDQDDYNGDEEPAEEPAGENGSGTDAIPPDGEEEPENGDF